MKLYLSLVRSQLMYYSQLWRPNLIKHIHSLERVQRRATKYILNDYSSDYKSRLMNLKLLPYMYIYEINDIIVFSSKPISHPLHVSISMIMLPFLITQPDIPSILSFCTLTHLLTLPDIFTFADFPGYGMHYLTLI